MHATLGVKCDFYWENSSAVIHLVVSGTPRKILCVTNNTQKIVNWCTAFPSNSRRGQQRKNK
jgi:hypothetical protein